jgi:cytochrome c553
MARLLKESGMSSSKPMIGPVVLLPLLFFAASALADTSLGENVYQHCSSCHGPDGAGGKGGEYPRIAGLPQAYIERQLENFKLRKRINKPMLPIFKNWRFNQEVMAAVAGYVNALPQPRIPPFEPSAERLADFDSREEFDALGRELFEGTCAQCHGEDGRGRADKDSPPLVNQYPTYLKKQIGDFVGGRRQHEHAEKMFGELYEEEVDSLLVHLGRLAEQARQAD